MSWDGQSILDLAILRQGGSSQYCSGMVKYLGSFGVGWGSANTAMHIIAPIC